MLSIMFCLLEIERVSNAHDPLNNFKHFEVKHEMRKVRANCITDMRSDVLARFCEKNFCIKRS